MIVLYTYILVCAFVAQILLGYLLYVDLLNIKLTGRAILYKNPTTWILIGAISCPVLNIALIISYLKGKFK